MAIDVTVTEQCDRCKRKEQIVISSDKIEAFEKRHEEREADCRRVDAFVEDAPERLPDLVVIFKGKVQMLSQVCDAHCANTVQNGVDALFRVHKERKPRTKKKKDGAGVEAATTSAKTKDKAKSKGGVTAATPAR